MKYNDNIIQNSQEREPLVSIIVPVYDTPARLLSTCIKSVFNQNYNQIELILVDDGSTSEKTIATIEKVSTSKKVSVIHEVNHGVSFARNVGLERARGDFILFLDSDDYLDPNYIKQLVSTAKEEKSDIVFSGKVNTSSMKNDAPFQEHHINLEEDSDAIVLRAEAFTSQGVLIKRQVAKKEKFTVGKNMGEDVEYMVKTMKHSRKNFFNGEGGYFYVQNKASVSHDNSLTAVRNYLNETIDTSNTLELYTQANKETITVYMLLKLTRAITKLAKANTKTKDAKTLAKQFLTKSDFRSIKPTNVYGQRFLTRKEKRRVLLLNYHQFIPLYLISKAKKNFFGILRSKGTSI